MVQGALGSCPCGGPRPQDQASFLEGGLASGFFLLTAKASLSWVHTVSSCQNNVDMLICGEAHSYEIQNKFKA